MTLKELSQLYHLNCEIEMDQRRLDELRAKATNTSPTLSDMPCAPGVSDKVAECVAEIVDLSAIISTKQQRCLHERNRLERYIANIDDSLTRQIFTLRFINGLTWLHVAAHIGGLCTEGYARNACYKHLRKQNATAERKMQKMQGSVL